MKTSTLVLPDLIRSSLLQTPTADLNSAPKNSFMVFKAFEWVNCWYVAIALEGLIVLLTLKPTRAHRNYKADKSKYKALLKVELNEFNAGLSSKNAHQARKPYKAPFRKCHPDKFKGQYQKAPSCELFQEIWIHRDHHAKPIQLKVKAEQNLVIKI